MALALLLLIQDGKCFHKEKITSSLFFGELGLDGSVKRINGLLPCVLSAKKKGRKEFFIPKDNLFELEYIPDITIYPISHFSALIDYF
jgi:magnesium chelatase family protein